MFNMGLSQRHLRKFHSNKIYSTVIFENLPQLIIQIWYFAAREQVDIVAVLAFVSSITSVFISLIDVHSSLSLTRAIKHAKKHGYFQIETYFFSLIGSTVIKNSKTFKMRPNTMRKIFAEIIECDVHCIECNMIVRIENGLEYGFTVFSFSSNDKKNNGRLKRMFRIFGSVYDDCSLNSNSNSNSNSDPNSTNGIFLRRIIEEFADGSSTTDIDISLSNIMTFYDDKNKYSSNFDQDYQAITQSHFYHLNSNTFSFGEIGIYKSIAINTSHSPSMSLSNISTQEVMNNIDFITNDNNNNNKNDDDIDIDIDMKLDEDLFDPPPTRPAKLSIHLSHRVLKENLHGSGSNAPPTHKSLTNIYRHDNKKMEDDLGSDTDSVDHEFNRFEWMRDAHQQIISDENNDNDVLDFGLKINVGQLLKKYVSAGHIMPEKQDIKAKETKQIEMPVDILRTRSASIKFAD